MSDARLGLSADALLTTTRAVRRRLDLERPVPFALVREAVEVAQQAPSGGDLQGWVWLAIDDPETKGAIAALYRKFFAVYREHAQPPEHAEPERALRYAESGAALAANLHRVPWLVIPCIRGPMGRADEGMGSFAQAMTWASIYPAVWSFQLALRERGLASCLTTNHLAFEREVAALLDIPFESVNQAALLPVAWSVGREFRPAKRAPVDDVLRHGRW